MFLLFNNYNCRCGSGVPMTYTWWNDGEPNNDGGIENCASYTIPNVGQGMNDAPCAAQLAYVCEVSERGTTK